MDDITTTAIDLSHHLQRQIVMQLRQDGPATYQQLKPDGVEGNAYNYHLRALKVAGFIDITDGVYQLTNTGHIVADGFSSISRRLMLRPYAHTALLITSADEVLLYSATRQPLNTVRTLPSGKMRYGDDVSTSLQREITRRELSDDYKASPLCLLNIRYLRNGTPIIHRPGTLWHIDYSGPLVTSRTQNGSAAWYDKASVLSGNDNDLTPDITLGLHRLASGSTEPIDVAFELP